MKVIKHKDKWYLQSETGYKEILLSTDDLLIKDGVQAIDDEFLEWFVKNPSCEEVKVEWVKTPDGIFYHQDKVPYGCYKIIIPKDCSKIKEGLEKSIKGKKHFVQHFKNGGTVEDFKPTEEDCSCTDECLGYLTKTCKGIETLEEFIKEVLEDEFFTNISEYKKAERLIDIGAKWQQENSYSEEEVGEIVYNIIGEYGKHYGIMIDGRKLNQLFEQFKKKQEWKV